MSSRLTDFERARELLGLDEKEIYIRISVFAHAGRVVLSSPRRKFEAVFKGDNPFIGLEGRVSLFDTPSATVPMAKLLGIFAGLTKVKLRLRTVLTNAAGMMRLPAEMDEHIDTLYTLQGKRNRVQAIKHLLDLSYDLVKIFAQDTQVDE